MELQQFTRRPFVVEAIEITRDNIEELARKFRIGRVRIHEETGDPYIALDRHIVPNVPRAYIGWFVTKLGDNYRTYSPKTFGKEFVPMFQAEVDDTPLEIHHDVSPDAEEAQTIVHKPIASIEVNPS